MDSSEIDAIKQRTMAEFRMGITQYYMALDTLQATTPSFDLDIATDVHPELADYTSKAGHERLKFWQNFYEGLATQPRYTVVQRYSTEENYHHGLTTGLDKSVAHAWLEVYEDLRPEHVSFERNEDTGEKLVSINKYAHQTHTQGASEATHLFSTDRPGPLWREHLATAHAHEPHVFFYADESALLLGVGDYGHIDDPSGYLQVKLSEELRELVAERIEEAGLIDR